jgi:hypothetical protein
MKTIKLLLFLVWISVIVNAVPRKYPDYPENSTPVSDDIILMWDIGAEINQKIKFSNLLYDSIIYAKHLNSDVVGQGIIQEIGGALGVNVDGATIDIIDGKLVVITSSQNLFDSVYFISEDFEDTVIISFGDDLVSIISNRGLQLIDSIDNVLQTVKNKGVLIDSMAYFENTNSWIRSDGTDLYFRDATYGSEISLNDIATIEGTSIVGIEDNSIVMVSSSALVDDSLSWNRTTRTLNIGDNNVFTNPQEDDYNFVFGVEHAIITASNCFISGASNTITSSQHGIINGVGGHLVNATGGVIGGGVANEIESEYSVIGGGYTNDISAGAAYTFIGGGINNFIGDGALYSVISGGRINQIANSNPISTYNFIGCGYQNYTSSGAINSILNGYEDTISGGYNSINGGKSNKIVGNYNSINSGRYNNITATQSVLMGGSFNTISDDSCFIGGGSYNIINSGNMSFIGGGYNNTITTGSFSFIGGGLGNEIVGSGGTDTDIDANVISGGYSNEISGLSLLCFIGGGNNNQIREASVGSVISGGLGNAISYDGTGTTQYQTISGGYGNWNYKDFATVGGGRENISNGQYGFVGGGYGNNVTGIGGVINGGSGNAASGSYTSVIGGIGCTAHDYGEVAGGVYSTVSGGNATSLVNTNRLFTLGNGVSTTLSNAFEIYRNGRIVSKSIIDTIFTADTNEFKIYGSVVADSTSSINFPYGQFISTDTQTIASVTKAYSIKYTSAVNQNKVLLTNDSTITIEEAGVYMITFSVIAKSTAVGKELDLWLEKDNTDVANTNTNMKFVGIGNERVITVTYIETFTAGQTMELNMWSDDTGTILKYTPEASTPTRPASPSIILTVNKISK